MAAVGDGASSVLAPEVRATVESEAAKVLHLGKNPTFGCGRLRVDLVDGA